MKQRAIVWRVMRMRPGLYGASALTNFLWYLVPLLAPLAVRRLFDELAGTTQVEIGIWSLLALFVAANLANAVTNTVCVGVGQLMMHTLGALIRRNLLRRVLRRPGARALPTTTGESLTRFGNDVDRVTEGMWWGLDPLGQLVMGLVALAVLVQVNAIVTLVVVVPTLIVLGIANAAGNRIQTARRRLQEASGRTTGFLDDVFSAVQSVKAAGAEEHVTRELERINEGRLRAALRDTLITQTLFSVSFNGSNLATGAILLLVGSSMRAGRFTTGDFALFVSYMGWLTTIVGFFGQFLTVWRQQGVSIRRLTDLLQGAPDQSLAERDALPRDLDGLVAPPASADAPAQLEVEGLTCLHPGSGRGVHDVSFRLDPGSFTVVCGRVGSGKTTLLRGLVGLLPRDAGRVRWNGADAEHLAPPMSAYVPQVPRLLSETIRENVLLGVDYEARLGRAFAQAVLDEDLEGFDAGAETKVGPRGLQVSGGQAQRIAAARALVREPALLVIDDVSSALDVETEAKLWDRLASRTCLVVSNRRGAIERADTVLLLDEGRLVAAGSPAELAPVPQFRALLDGAAGHP